MGNYKKSQILTLSLILALLCLTPFLSTTIKPTHLYFIINILIVAVGAEAGLLSASPDPSEGVASSLRVVLQSKVEKISVAAAEVVARTATKIVVPLNPAGVASSLRVVVQSNVEKISVAAAEVARTATKIVVPLNPAGVASSLRVVVQSNVEKISVAAAEVARTATKIVAPLNHVGVATSVRVVVQSNVEKITVAAAEVARKVKKVKMCSPSIFFISGGEAEGEDVFREEEGGEARAAAYALEGQELSTKADTFIRNFYMQLKMQREVCCS